jgi:DNA mismatch endonuclease, patch repair protein
VSRKTRKRKLIALTRSENMSRIRSKDTAPEWAVRRALWAAGLRYRLHDKNLPGRPDLVFPRRRTVVFVHGCFWHSHAGCRNFRLPKTRSSWWAEKLARNKSRDAEVRESLRAKGWKSLVIWECEVCHGSEIEALVKELSVDH